MELINILAEIQKNLKAPKGQFNSFGKYNYRNCEDILEAVKPLLGGAVLVISDELINFNDRYYVKATASIRLNGEDIETTAYAREAETKKGMDVAQVTGAASSYARKYALNGLFLIDDTKDPDNQDNSAKKTPAPKVDEREPIEKPDKISDDQALHIADMLFESGSDKAIFLEYFNVKAIENMNQEQYEKGVAMIKRKGEKNVGTK
jgi:hypothetical protein